MMRFLLAYVAIFGGLHGYLYWKVRAAFPRMRRPLRWALAALLPVMVFAPMVVRLLDRAGLLPFPSFFSMLVLSWMVVAFWLFVICLCADLWWVATRLAGLAVPRARRFSPERRSVLITGAGLAAAGFAWGLVEAADIRAKEVAITTPHMPPGSDPFRIVQISDVHLGRLVGEGRLATILGVAASLRPDVLVSTGDLVDADIPNDGALARMLADAPAPLGKFAVTGNHEFYAGLERSLEFHRAAGFRVLRGESAVVDGRVRIAGVDDPARPGLGADPVTDEHLALPEAPNGMPTVFLKHRPVVEESSAGRFDLQLSGHVHGGQVFPFGLIVRMIYPRGPGLHTLPGGGRLYVSRGSGTWGPPIRVLAPPEVTLFTLRPAKG